MSINEDLVEQAVLAIMQELGWRFEDPLEIAPDGPSRQRGAYGEVVLAGLLEDAARRLNPEIPEEALQSALRQVQVSETPSLIEENRVLLCTYKYGGTVLYCIHGGTTNVRVCTV